MRKTFYKLITDIIKNEKDTTYFTVDIGMWAVEDILRDYPNRAMNVGVYEDGMFSITAGMALAGLIPTIYGIQPYLIERTLEQIKLDFAYQKVGVNVVGTGAAIDYSKYGYSHYCAEDIGLIKLIPGVEFVAPGTARQFEQLFKQSYRNGHPTFFRISDHPNKYECDVEFGKAKVLKTGKKATVIVVSVMLDVVMDVCKDEDVTVLYYTTLEPFDRKTLADYCAANKIVVCEPHFVGSLLYDIHEALPDKALHIKSIGFPREIFRNYGIYDEKIRYYELTADKFKEVLNSMYLIK